MAEPVTGNDFIDKLLEQAPPTVSQPRRGQNYNYPERLYLKPDGMVVSLQADPHNRAYYEDKGYHLLSDSPGRTGQKSELRQYVEDEYPRILKEQKDKAAIINAIRRAGERYRDLNLETTFDDYSLDELRAYLKQIKDEEGKDIRVVLPKRQQAREDAQTAKLLAGIETAESQSIERFQEVVQHRGPGRPPRGER